MNDLKAQNDNWLYNFVIISIDVEKFYREN